MLPRRFPLAALILALGSCATPSAPPPPPRAATPAPPKAPPPPVPLALSGDWRDWPPTPGDWAYRQLPSGSVAQFGPGRATPLLTLTCDRASRQVRLARFGPNIDITIRTSSTMRALNLMPGADGYGVATLAANDPLLDAMGFSRGRFVVQQYGAQPLVVPAWAEILRVAEDCRS